MARRGTSLSQTHLDGFRTLAQLVGGGTNRRPLFLAGERELIKVCRTPALEKCAEKKKNA